MPPSKQSSHCPGLCLHVLQVVGLADVEGVAQHQVPQAPQRVGHGGVGALALEPVRGQAALLLLGQVHVSSACCKNQQGLRELRVTPCLEGLFGSTPASYIDNAKGRKRSFPRRDKCPLIIDWGGDTSGFGDSPGEKEGMA